jgi:hypothetical protein
MAGALVLFASLPACGGERSTASKSASGSAQTKPEAAGGEGHHAGHHSAVEAPAGGGGQVGHGHEAHAGDPAPGHAGHGAQQGAHGAAGAEPPGGDHAGHGRSSSGGRTSAGQSETQHAGHGTTSPQAPSSGTRAHDEHAGHSPSGGEMPSVATAPAPVAVPPEQPAKTLQPDALDAPAASSVLDAQRSAEMAQGMAGEGHSGHGGGTYRHVDVGREPGAAPATPAPSSHEGEHEHTSGVAESTDVVYVCPMHPEVTSETPGTCPKCGMALVQRRKG